MTIQPTNNALVRYFLSIAYDGTSYSGWQKQPHGNTIQDCIEVAFAKIGHSVSIVGSSRTDAKVHARGQVAHVDMTAPIETKKLQKQLNAVLPPNVCITGIDAV